jgi:carboxymethylenebutenolidase
MTIDHQNIVVGQDRVPLTIASATGRGAAVVIMPSAFGIASDLKAQMEELALEASLVVAIDPFFRDGSGMLPYEDMTRVMERLRLLDRERAYRDLVAAIEWTKGVRNMHRVVVLGVCFGGLFALLTAADGLADAVVTWHGTRLESVLERAFAMRCPMHFHIGEADPFVSKDAVGALQTAFAGRHDVRIFVHEGATHGFSHRGATRAYQPRAERAGMASLIELLRGAGAKVGA